MVQPHPNRPCWPNAAEPRWHRAGSGTQQLPRSQHQSGEVALRVNEPWQTDDDSTRLGVSMFTVWGAGGLGATQYEYCTELAQLQQCINVCGHSTALIWLYSLPELSLYPAEMHIHDAKPELIHSAGCGQLPTKLSKVSFPPQCDWS